MGKYLRIYRLGEIVDVVGDGAIHKGMPHKYYHGKTGKVWNVTPRAIGVMLNKRVGNRIIQKKIHVRVEHVQHSKCREEFLQRVKKNDKAKKLAKGKSLSLKRKPALPQSGKFIRGGKCVETIAPQPHVVLYH
jgi:large subunit ribosomal protein L21e